MLRSFFEKYDRLVLFDTETTGLAFSRDEIIQFSAVVLECREGIVSTVQQYDHLVTLSPGGFVPPKIQQLTGITDLDIMELGIPKGSCTPEELFSFVYYAKFDGLSEYEFDHVLLADYDGPITPNPEEIMDLRWVAFEDLKQEMEAYPQHFSSWFMIAAPKVLAQFV